MLLCTLAKRSDSKRYPAIDPIESYSKYLEYDEVKEYISENISADWNENVTIAKDVLIRGREAQEQINILGDDGVPVAYHVRFWKSEVIDFIILQQDAFDKIDSVTPLDRQKYMLDKVLEINDTEMEFSTFEETATWFKKIINICRQMNYSPFNSEQFRNYEKELDNLVKDIAKL